MGRPKGSKNKLKRTAAERALLRTPNDGMPYEAERSSIRRQDIFKILWKDCVCQVRVSTDLTQDRDYTFTLYQGDYPSAVATGRPASDKIKDVRREAKEWTRDQVLKLSKDEQYGKVLSSRKDDTNEWRD